MRLGTSLDGEFYASEADEYYGLYGGFYGSLHVDYYVVNNLGFGLYGSYWTPDAEYYGTVYAYGVGLNIKPRYIIPEAIGRLDVVVTLIGSVGYRTVSLDRIDESTDGLNLGLGLELALQRKNWSFFVEPGFQTQPVGGNSLTDITFGPVWHFTGGVAFRF
jgi:hypothetical protein